MPFSTQATSSPSIRRFLAPAAARARRSVRRVSPFAFAVVMISAAVALGAPGVGAQENKAQPAPVYFVGEVEYKVSASGSNKEGVAAFKSFSPERIRVVYGRQGFRLIETGGSEHNVLLNYATGVAYLLDAEAKTATKVSVANLDSEDNAQMAAFMPYHYQTDLRPTGNVGGHACREYQVLTSAFVRKGAKASVCVAEAVRFKPSRYSFESESRRVDSPLPLSLPVKQGAILRMEINESGVTAVYEAEKITPGAPAAELFSVPAGYEIKANE